MSLEQKSKLPKSAIIVTLSVSDVDKTKKLIVKKFNHLSILISSK